MKTLLRAIAIVCFAWLLLAEIVSCGSSTRITSTTKGSFKHLDAIPRNSPDVLLNSDPNYMSKRKVPNGPDPIHNRRAGKSGQTPGRA